MTSTALGFSAFGVTTRTTRSTLFPEARDVGTCVVAGRRVLVAAFGVIRRTHAANLVALPTTPPDDTSSDAFSAFTCGLGLGEDMITARKELAAEIKKSSSATGLKLLRLEAGLSQRQLAQAVGTSQPENRHHRGWEEWHGFWNGAEDRFRAGCHGGPTCRSGGRSPAWIGSRQVVFLSMT